MERKIREILVKITERESFYYIDLHQDFYSFINDEIGYISLYEYIKFIVALEEEFNIFVMANYFRKLNSIGKTLFYLNKELKEYENE